MITIKFETDNSAFGETASERAEEIARILREIADKFADDSSLATGEQTHYVRDVNGNRIGHWQAEHEDAE